MSVFLQFRSVSGTLFWVGRRAGAEPPAKRSVRPAPDALRSKPQRFFDRAGVSTLGSWNGSADFKQTSTALIAPARCFRAAPLWLAAKLLLADEGERGAEPFVLDYRALIDLLDLVEGSVGQLDTVVADRKPAIGVIDDGDPLADRRLGLLGRLQK